MNAANPNGKHPDDDDALLTPAEVAAMFRVNPKTVTRWARAGKLNAIRTLGGHRRFRASEIRRSVAGSTDGASGAASNDEIVVSPSRSE